MKRAPENIFWMGLGAIGGFIAASLSAAVLVLVLSTKVFRDYQTFFGALIALLGALATIWILRLQIRQAEESEKDRRDRRSLASRSVMPTSLSVLGGYTRSCIQQLSNLHRNAAPGQGVQLAAEVQIPFFPEVPEAPIPVLRDVVENADISVSIAIADMLGWLQVTNARLNSLEAELRGVYRLGGHARIVPLSEIEGAMIDVVELNARIASLFDYARRETDTAPPAISLQNMTNSMFVLGIGDLMFPGVTERVRRQYEGGN